MVTKFRAHVNTYDILFFKYGHRCYSDYNHANLFHVDVMVRGLNDLQYIKASFIAILA